MAKESTVKTKVETVSFKLPIAEYKLLKEYAEAATNDSGFKLSPSMAARKLMLDALKQLSKKKS